MRIWRNGISFLLKDHLIPSFLEHRPARGKNEKMIHLLHLNRHADNEIGAFLESLLREVGVGLLPRIQKDFLEEIGFPSKKCAKIGTEPTERGHGMDRDGCGDPNNVVLVGIVDPCGRHGEEFGLALLPPRHCFLRSEKKIY